MKIFKFLFSGWFMGVLLVVFAYAIGYATFVENDYGAIAAKVSVYNARWFEVLLFLMVVNFAGMIFTKHLYLKSKWNILIIHIALVIIIIGAGVTRYYGFEGQMHIREGKSSNIFKSSDTYLYVQLKEGDRVEAIEKKILLAQGMNDLLSLKHNWNDNPIKIDVLNFYPNAIRTLVKSESGEAYLSLVIGGKSGRIEFSLKQGESRMVEDIGISFGDTTRRDIVQIMQQADELYMRIPQALKPDSLASELETFVPVQAMTMLRAGETTFVIRELINGRMEVRPAAANAQNGVPIINVLVNDMDVALINDEKQEVMLGNTEVTLRVGTKMLELPFSVKLNEFDLDRYPGSNSPSSFASEVTVIDESNNVEMPYRIYMNHILNYGGYRFFQSSYDLDERGTILSVTTITGER